MKYVKVLGTNLHISLILCKMCNYLQLVKLFFYITLFVKLFYLFLRKHVESLVIKE